MYHGETEADILSRFISYWPSSAAMGGPPTSGSPLFMILELIAREMSNMSSQLAELHNSHIHIVSGHISSEPQTPPLEPTVALSGPEAAPLIPTLEPSDFMPELKKV